MKGNVDVDIVFEMLRDAFTNAQIEKAILVSGDGDYFGCGGDTWSSSCLEDLAVFHFRIWL